MRMTKRGYMGKRGMAAVGAALLIALAAGAASAATGASGTIGSGSHAIIGGGHSTPDGINGGGGDD